MSNELDNTDQNLTALVTGLRTKNKIQVLSKVDCDSYERRLLFLLWANPAMIQTVESMRGDKSIFAGITGDTNHALIYQAMILASQDGDVHATAVYDNLSKLRDSDPIHSQFRFTDVLEIYDDQWWRSRNPDLEVSEVVYCTELLIERKR